jgi:hypothetical protein
MLELENDLGGEALGVLWRPAPDSDVLEIKYEP